MSRRSTVTGGSPGPGRAGSEESRGVDTTVVCPGFVHTRPGSGLRSPDPAPARTAAKLIARGSITPEQVAEQVVAGVVAQSWRRTKAMLDAQDRQEQHQ